MTGLHMWLGIGVLASNSLAAAWGAVAWLRKRPSLAFWPLLRVAQGFVALPGQGPILTWRGLTETAAPPLSAFALTLGDIELF